MKAKPKLYRDFWTVRDCDDRIIIAHAAPPRVKSSIVPLCVCIFNLMRRALRERRNITYTYRPLKRGENDDAGASVTFNYRGRNFTIGDTEFSHPVRAYEAFETAVKESTND